MFVEHKEIGEVSEAPADTMKLSRAIRIGAAKRPQGFGGVLIQRDMGTSCALLAAYEAENGYPSNHARFESPNLTDWANKRFGEKVRAMAMAKNDTEHWSRERIADWLEVQGY